MFKKSLLQLISINNFKFLSISQTTSIRIEHSSSNTENLFVSNFKIADLFLITVGYNRLQANIALCSF